ncbi:MAG: hypothetical protein HKN67_06095 [Saprospiraceae bacterium]|nr:hypothetical protein [Saprospiraceae bacterium]
MKHIIYISFFFLVGLSQDTLAQTRLTYPSLDKSLLNVWLACENNDIEVITLSLDKTEKVWDNIKGKISREKVEHFDMNLVSKDLDQLMKLMRNSYVKKDYEQLKSYAYHFLWEFRSIRQCSFLETYPLDLLFNAYDLYTEIHYTIHDEMFGLREWTDFEDLVNDFICEYEAYDLIHDEEIMESFSGMDFTSHQNSKDKVANCLHNLLMSFESGYQRDFTLPCDELGHALLEMFDNYGKSINTSPVMSKGEM